MQGFARARGWGIAVSEFKLGIVGKGKKQNILESVLTPHFLVTHVLSPPFGSVLDRNKPVTN